MDLSGPAKEGAKAKEIHRRMADVYDDNAPVHKSRVAQAAIRECKFEQLNHPPYIPDLAPSDYYLFRNLKSHLHGTRFRDDDELKAATEAWFEDKIDDFYFKGIDCLKEKWAKCIEVKGDHIEK